VPEVLEAIREFWPDVCYVGWRQIYMSPKESQTETRQSFFTHCLGSFVWNPHKVMSPPRVMVPADYVGEPPNQIDVPIRLASHWYNCLDLPQMYAPLDWRVYHYIKTIYDPHISPAEYDVRFLKGKLEAIEREKESAFNEYAAMRSDIDSYMLKKLERFTELEYKDYYRSYQELRAKQRLELQAALERDKESKPRLFSLRGDN
jgi:hypothetical protein